MNQRTMLYWMVAFILLLGFYTETSGAQGNAPATTPTTTTEDTNSQETLRSYLQLQEQLHATQLAIERAREAEAVVAAQRSRALDERLGEIEKALGAERGRELDAMQNSERTMQSSNRVMLIVAGAFATVGFVAMLLTAYFQWRTVNRLSEISRTFPSGPPLGSGPALAALGPGENNLVSVAPADQTNQRLLGAIDRLEKRIHELERATEPPLPEGTPAEEELAGSEESRTPVVEPSATSKASDPAVDGSLNGKDRAEGAENGQGERIRMILGKGESMLNLEDAEGALKCFDEILALEPQNTEALVKKGLALEKLRRLDDALACYDRAIAVDESMTIAYLHKGGLYNRMERFTEALQCYEKALRSQEALKRET